MKKKIWIIANWDEIYDKNVGLRVFRNFPSFNEFELSETDYEYLIVLGGIKPQDFKYFKDRTKTFGFILEPEWSSNWQRDLYKYCKFVFAQNKNMFPEADNIIEYPSIMLTQSTDSFIYYNTHSFPKTKRMSIISSNYSHNFNYTKRYELFTSLLKTDLEIDFFGRDWKLSDPRYKGSPYNKSDAIKNYKYSIAIENSNYKNYLTEKFFDLVVCNTVPIYYGCINADEIYPSESFIKINFDCPIEQTVEQIKNIYNNDSYEKRVQHVLDAKKIYYDKYNLFNVIKGLITK
jgi:hypothetical protein